MTELAHNTRDDVRVGTVSGLVTLILGMLSIVAPGISGVSVAFLVGVLLTAAGIARLIFAFEAKSFGSGVLTFLLGGLSILVGLVMVGKPLLGLVSLTLALAAFFAADGIVEFFGAFKVKPAKGWVWMIISGIVSIILAGLIVYQWPVSGEWAIGILVGVRLIFAGWSMIGLGSMHEAYAEGGGKASTR